MAPSIATTAPIGTSSAAIALRASTSAACINSSSETAKTGAGYYES